MSTISIFARQNIPGTRMHPYFLPISSKTISYKKTSYDTVIKIFDIILTDKKFKEIL